MAVANCGEAIGLSAASKLIHCGTSATCAASHTQGVNTQPLQAEIQVMGSTFEHVLTNRGTGIIAPQSMCVLLFAHSLNRV